MKGAPTEENEILRCPITDAHLDGSSRISELSLQVKHNDRAELDPGEAQSAGEVAPGG